MNPPNPATAHAGASASAPRFAIVAAADQQGGIGRAGGLPWHLRGDLAHFRRLTRGNPTASRRNAVVMGRRTWDSIPPKRRPLADRLNVVLTRNPGLPLPAGAWPASSFDRALERLAALPDLGQVFVIGGEAVFREALAHPGLTEVHLTRIEGRFDCDTFLPPLPDDLELVSESPRQHESDLSYRFCLYRRRVDVARGVPGPTLV